MAHIQYMPGDPRLVDQLVYELKSKGIFDQFRKDCIADVDTRPAYQNLRQRVENSVSTFLSRQTWQPDLNKNQLREKLRKHILDGNYLEQGVERIVDQVVNPKVATIFIPKVEDLVYNYLGVTRKKTNETANEKTEDLLPTDLEAVSPGSVKSNDGKEMEVDQNSNMEIDESPEHKDNDNKQDDKTDVFLTDTVEVDKNSIPLPSEEIKPENIPPPDQSPPKIELEKIELPKEGIISQNIPLPEDSKDKFFKPLNSEDDDSSSNSSLRRNMSPLTPIRNFNNENSCDAQQAFENDLVSKEDKKEPSSFRFAIEAKSPGNNTDIVKAEKKEDSLAYQFNSQVNINNFNTPLYEDSSNSNILHIDYESDANSKVNQEKVEPDLNSEDSKKERKEERKSSHKSSHRSRDSHKHSSSRDKKSDSKQSSRDSSRHDKSKSSKDDSKSKSNKDRSRDRSDKKDSRDSRDSSRHRSSHKSSHKDSKSHRSSSSSHRHSSKHSDDKKSYSSHKDKSSDKSSSDKRKDSKSSHHSSDKDRKSSSSSSKSDRSSSKSKHDDKDKDKKSKKETDDHYSLSGRGNRNRRSTDRDSNDGSSSSKGSTLPSNSKTSESKKESKSSSKSETTSTSSDSTSPSDKENIVQDHGKKTKEIQQKPVVRIESYLEQPLLSPPRLPFVPDVTIKKPKFAANLEEAKRLMKMRKFLDEEQKRMNQEAALLLEFQANVRPSLSQVYSSIPGPELEFACVTNNRSKEVVVQTNDNLTKKSERDDAQKHYTSNQLLNVLNDASVVVENNSMKEQNEVDESIDQNKSQEINEKDEFDKENDEQQDCEVEKTEEDIKKESPVINNTDGFEVTVIAEALSENEEIKKNDRIDNLENNNNKETSKQLNQPNIADEKKLHYFAEHEKYNAEIERAKFAKFFKEYNTKSMSEKIYLINCDSYEENLIRDVSKSFGNFEIVNYHKNGHLKLPKTKNVVKDVNISNEITLPFDGDDTNDYDSRSNIFSPEKSECSFELTTDYNAKLEEMVNKTSRQEIMEIILGNIGESPTKMPRIDYLTDSNIDSEYEYNKKRKISDESINNNRNVLTPNKIRKLSTDQITSTTEETEEEQEKVNSTRSKYLGKARRVGLPRPKKPILPNSPSSDKSVENYEQNTQTAPLTPNGKIKRAQVQRYDTSDLYKPKLHFLSRRNHIT